MKLNYTLKKFINLHIKHFQREKGNTTVIEVLKLILDESKSERAVAYAIQSLQELSNSESTTANIILILGHCYRHGLGVTKYIQAAIMHYEKAATLNCALAKAILGSCYKQGIGVTKDAKRAAELFEQAAAQDLPVAKVLALPTTIVINPII